MPEPELGYAIVFKHYFTYGLCIPPYSFLRQVMEVFRLELHHINPNGIITLSKFCWACESYASVPNIDTFYAYFELQKQPKKIKTTEGEFIA